MAQVLNVEVILNSNGSITANWNEISGATRYHAHMYTSSPLVAYYNEKDLHTTSYTSKPNLPANRMYKVVVVAHIEETPYTVSGGGQVLILSDFYNNVPLEVPQNVRATADTVSVTVSFSKVNRASSYDILFDGNLYNVSNTTKMISGLKPKTNHTYAVRAKNANRTGDYSETQTIMTKPLTPAIPQSFKKIVTETSVTISWNEVREATNYDIVFNGSMYNVSSPSKTITGLTPAKSYTFKVRSKNADATSEYSTELTVTTAPPPPASTSADVTENAAIVSWSPVTGAVAYGVRLNKSEVHVFKTSNKFEPLAPDTTYTYQVCSKSMDGPGSYSPLKTFRTPPRSPETVHELNFTKNSVTLRWNAVSGATSYDLLFDGKNYRVTDTTKTISGLKPGTTYSYSLRSNNADGSSSYGPEKTVTTLPNPPAVPADVSVSATEDSVTISWEPVEGATSYDINFNDTIYNVTGNSKTITGLKSNTSYNYSVRANNAGGSSTFTASKTIKTPVKLPNVPSNINSTASKNSVTLKWEPVSGATSYDVKFNGSTYRVTDTSKTITGLRPGTSYNYSIRANNADGSSSYSPEQTIETIPNPPGVPGNISTSVTSNSATISWNPVAGATSYDVQFNGNTYRVTEPSKTLTGLKPGTSYTYTVRANNAGGSSTYTTSKTFTTKPNPPGQPTNVNATVSSNSATISWTPVAGATSYDVVFNGNTYRVTSTSKTITGLNPGQSYSYSVRANNDGGSSSYSAPKTVAIPPKVPEIPVNVSASATTNTVTVSWGQVSGATSYDVRFNGTTYRVTGLFHRIAGLSPGTNYSYSVRANNSAGSSAYSAVKTIQTQEIPPGEVPNVNASATADSVTVSWSPVYRATSYDILFQGVVYNVTGTSKKITGLEPNTSYSYAVRAKNSSGASAYSASKTILTLLNPPETVTATSTNNSVTVKWSIVNGATGYQVQLNNAVYNVSDVSKTITGLLADTNYSYAVRAISVAGYSEYSKTQMIRTLQNPPAEPTNISATATAHTVNVKWNPVNGADSYEVLLDGKCYVVTKSEAAINGLVANTDYTYQVRSVNAVGKSAYSELKTIRTRLDIPENIYPEVSTESMKVKWNPVTGATGYDIIFDGKLYYVTDTFKEFTGLKTDTYYTFSLCAKNEVVTSEYSQEYGASTVLDVPENVRAIATLNSVIVFWDPVAEAVSYDVEFDSVAYPVNGSVRAIYALSEENAEMAGTYKVFSGLKPNTEHSYCVRSNGNVSSSAYSPLQFIDTKISKQNGLPDVKQNKFYPDGKIPHTGLDPVNALTGAFLWSYTCFEDYGKDALHFTIMYDSQRDDYPKALGSKWTYSFNYLLYMDDEYAYFSTPNDEVIPFAIQAGTGGFTLADGIQSGYTMGRKDNQEYYVKDIDGTEYIFGSNLCLTKVVEGGLVSYRFDADSEGRITRIEGRHGRSLTISYAGEHISQVTDTLGNTVTFSYHSDYLTSVVDPGGNNMDFTYDEYGNLLEIADFSGGTYLTNQYDIYGRVVAQNMAGRGNSTVSYDETERITIFTDELGNETKYYYDECGHITVTELAGAGIQNKYNELGQLTQQTDGLGNITQMAYDEYGRMNRVTYPDGSAEQVFYNNRNYPIRMIDRDGTESLYSYDARNNLVSAQDERGNTARYTYDEEDNLISYTDKEGHVWSYTYDPQGHLSQAVDSEGNIYKYEHDAIGRLISSVSPAGRTTSYLYSAEGNLLRINYDDGTVAFEYDRNGNQTGVVDKSGNRQRLEYNAMGQIQMVTDFMGNEYRFRYDEKGNLIKETDPLGYVQNYEYDALGNCMAWTDKNGGKTNYSFNAANQLTEVKDAAGNLVKYAYDTMGQVKAVTDALNFQTSYSYDAMGRITGITNALGHSVSYTYDQVGNLLTKTDEEGGVTAYAYDKENRLSSVTSDAGVVRFTYDKLGRVTAIQDESGFSEKAGYDGDGNMTSFSDKEGNSRTYVYDKAGRLSEETDPNGGKITYVYDKNGNLTGITNAGGHQFLYEYDAGNRLTKTINPLHQETSYGYNARGELILVTDAKGGKTTFAYDGNGNLIREINPAGGVMTYTYDALNRLTQATDEVGNQRSFVYDGNGNMTSYTDANQNLWTYEYDAVNRLIGVTGQDGGRLSYTYTKTGEIAGVTDQEGIETSYRYDTMGRLLEMTDGIGNSLSWTYDSQGRVLTQTDANGNTTEYEYSPSGNLLQAKDAEGNRVTYTYNALGQVLTQTDALGNIRSYEYDALGQTISITDAMGGKTSFTYTANGEIATVTDANGGITQYQYDACGNLIQTTDPLGHIVQYEYDAVNNQTKECLSSSGGQLCATIYQYDKKGQVVREINPMSNERSYTYDGNGNPVTILDEDGNETRVRYDLNNKPISMTYGDGREAAFRYNKRGELVELKDWNGTVAMEYDKAGRLAKVTDFNGQVTGYSYDANGNRTGITYPDASVISYSYDKNNRMTKVTDAEGKITRYEYRPTGETLSIHQPGSSSSYTYNANGLPTQVAYQFDDGTAMKESFAYDALGNIISSERTGGSLSTKAQYSYDALGQLLGCKEGSRTEAYSYDNLGNRILKEVNGSREASYQYNAGNQLISRTEKGIHYGYEYDKRGNLTGEKRGDKLIRQYLYDATGHMSVGMDLETDERTEYGYNALYMRVKNVQQIKDRSGNYISRANGAGGGVMRLTRETSYVPDYLSITGNDLMSVEKGFGETRAVYGRGYERLSQKVTAQPGAPETARSVIASATIGKSYFQPDIYGSALFAASERGEVLRYAERNAWGDLEPPVWEDMNTSGVEQGLRYTGYSYDQVIDKYYAQARFYDAGQGRMLGRDPVKRGLNGYPYCENDPVNYVDPTGEVANIIAGGAIGGFAGGIFGFGGSALSQISSGKKFSFKKALGSAANGAVVGAVRGALVGSGAGVAATLVSNFAAGAAGNALEQRIGRGKVNIRESVTSGLTNAVSGAIYGNHPLKSAKDALVRGAGAGAATAAINHLSNAWDSRRNTRQDNSWNPGSMAGGTGISPYMTKRDPKAGCVTASPVRSGIGYSGGYGYQYKTPGGSQKGRNNNSIVSFGKDVLIGAVMGGLSSVSFYGADKALGSLKRSIRGDKGGSSTVGRSTQGQGFSERGYNPRPGERTLNGYVEQNANPEVALYTNSTGFNNSKGNVGGQFKRLGAEEHYGLSPHVHQPVRNIAPNGTIYGRTGKTVGVDTLPPSPKDVKQLYEYLNNGKYHQ